MPDECSTGAPEVSGDELVAQEHGRRTHGLLDDPAGVQDAGNELEAAVPLPLAVGAVAEEPAAGEGQGQSKIWGAGLGSG